MNQIYISDCADIQLMKIFASIRAYGTGSKKYQYITI